jgi:predicted TIM-barrel enzyme
MVATAKKTKQNGCPIGLTANFARGRRGRRRTGVQNFPTVGLIDGSFRSNLEDTGMGYQLEIDMIRTAHELDLVTTPYVFSAADATQMARAGADVVVAHMGLTTSGSVGARTTTKSLDDCVREIQAIRDAAVEVAPDVVVLCHGGPIARPEDARFVLERVRGLHGFFGASSMERLPVEEAIAGITREFKSLSTERG